MVGEQGRRRPRAPRARGPTWLALGALLVAGLVAGEGRAARGPGPAGASAGPGPLPVPRATQAGEVANCGPTAAAMLLAAYVDGPPRVERLRDAVGRWTWDRFPLRRLALPGYDAGMTTPTMLLRALRHFAPEVRWRDGFAHPWLPREVHALATLRGFLDQGRPVLALVQTRILWGFDAPGLHWIVIRGLRDGEVVYNDPGDGLVGRVPVVQLYRAWRLDPLFRHLGPIRPFVGLVAERPVPRARGVARAAGGR